MMRRKNNCCYRQSAYCTHKGSRLDSHASKRPVCPFNNERKCPLWRDSKSKIKSVSESLTTIDEGVWHSLLQKLKKTEKLKYFIDLGKTRK